MVYYNSLKTEKERSFVAFHGEKNCFIKTLENINIIYEIMLSSPEIYNDDDRDPDQDFYKVAKKYASKEVLIVHTEYPNPILNNNFICGDDNWVFIDEMFVDGNF